MKGDIIRNFFRNLNDNELKNLPSGIFDANVNLARL